MPEKPPKSRAHASKTRFSPPFWQTTAVARCKPSLENYYAGMMDDFRLYDYALSLGEVAWLSSRTEPFDKPF